MELALLATVDNSIDAELIASKLRNHGIEVYLFNKHFSSLMPHFFGIMGSGIQIKVSPNDIELAREISNLNNGKVLCPNCKSEKLTLNIEKRKNKIGLFLAMLLFATPAGNLINFYSCDECGTNFKR